MTTDEIIERSGRLPASQIAKKLNHVLMTDGSAVVTAPPGAGKSTLLPLTVLAGLETGGKILMLEPRRLAARQIAERMADILGETVGHTVGYRVRFESKVSKDTRIEVLTEGILTRMLVDDATLEGVDVVIFDEFHERSINSDLALALTRQSKEIIRPDLKLVVMSATIDTEDICRQLHAPLLESEGRMYGVDIIHSKEDTSPQTAALDTARTIIEAHDSHEGDILAFLPGQADIEQCHEMLTKGSALGGTAVYPLYGNLSPEMQRRAIAPSEEGERKVVLATPIAETSITIEGVRIVVDSGLCRSLVFNQRTGLSRLETTRISLDMATQRTGRAGRVAPGVCYRLWTLATEHRMEPQRGAEIEKADLAPMVLSVGAFGESDVLSLPWLTMPPKASVAKAMTLLHALGATDSAGAVTPLGRKMSAMPCHPRIARMIAGAKSAPLKALACDIAAVMEEKDPMADTCQDADITLRLDSMRTARRTRQAGRWKRIIRIADEYRRMAHAEERNEAVAPDEAGSLLAMAYPERIAIATDNIGGYRMASGNDIQLQQTDPLTSHSCVVAASLNVGTAGKGRVFLAAPIDLPSLDGSFFTLRDNISWDSKQGRVVMQRERRIGKLTVDCQPLQGADRNEIIATICQAAKKEGLSMFYWSDDVRRMQERVQTVAEWHPELAVPDLSTSRLLDTAHEWLPLYLDNGQRLLTTTAEMKKIDLAEVLWAQIPYDIQQQIDRIAPTHVTVPTGSRIRIDYRSGAEAPVVSVRLQECFGMEHTPCVDGGKRHLLMELLSPGFKPVQLTQDLESFWKSTYFEVRKELRRRYPKHYWPENPLEAEAVRGVKRR